MSSARSLLSAGFLVIAALACKDSNTVAGPAAAPASLAGTWTGSYSSKMPSCPQTPVTISFTQDGADVVGSLATNACGPHGFFKARISGSSVTGRIELAGCTGGGVLGQVHGNVLSLSIGDFYQPLVREGEVVILGGAVTLSR